MISDAWKRGRCAQWEGKGESALPPGGAFLVVVAKNGPNDRPDPSTMRSFIMESSSGLSYAAGTWRESMMDAKRISRELR